MAADGGSPLCEVRAPFWPTSEGLFRSSGRFTPEPVPGKRGGARANALHAFPDYRGIARKAPLFPRPTITPESLTAVALSR